MDSLWVWISIRYHQHAIRVFGRAVKALGEAAGVKGAAGGAARLAKALSVSSPARLFVMAN